MVTVGVEPQVWVIRHGETEWSRAGRHTSRTDLDLTAAGEEQARGVGAALEGVVFDVILCSPMLRARRTAELAGLTASVIDDDLREWDYGDLEGRRASEIQTEFPGWTIWNGPWPGGETAAEVSARADRVVLSVLASGASRVAAVGHGHFSRVLAARWVGAEVEAGRWLDLDTASISELGWSKGSRVVRRWNTPA